MRLAVDTGGTFTDLVIEENGSRRLFKSPTTPRNPVEGVLDVLSLAARDGGITREELLGRAELVIYGTTHAINAILTGSIAKTAFLTTEGHPRHPAVQGGRATQPFNHRRPYPRGYVPDT